MVSYALLISYVSSCRYWSALLQNRGVDVLPFDITVKRKYCWSKVHRGGPEVLLDRAMKGERLSCCNVPHYVVSDCANLSRTAKY